MAVFKSGAHKQLQTQLVRPLLTLGDLTSFRRVTAAAGGGGGGGTSRLAIDWGTTTGQTDTALLDTGKTPHLIESRGVTTDLNVESAAGKGFPAGMTNVLRCRHPAGVTESAEVMASDSSETPASAVLPALSVGTWRFYRLYVRFPYSDADVPAAMLSNMHGIENSPNNTSWNWHWANRADGKFDLNLWHDPDPTAGTNYQRWYPNGTVAMGLLTKTTTYRLEWAIRATDATHCAYQVRIYDDTNTLLYPDGSGLTIMKAEDGTSMYDYNHLLSATELAALRFLRLPKNGGPIFTNDADYYVGGLKVVDGDWCGPYSAVTG